MLRQDNACICQLLLFLFLTENNSFLSLPTHKLYGMRANGAEIAGQNPVTFLPSLPPPLTQFAPLEPHGISIISLFILSWT
ncbi:hypothetical protein C8R45DRAFT_1014620, partial [Mycena sanguinolenta]